MRVCDDRYYAEWERNPEPEAPEPSDDVILHCGSAENEILHTQNPKAWIRFDGPTMQVRQ